MKPAPAALALTLIAIPAAAQAPASMERLIAVATSLGTQWMQLPHTGDYVRVYPAAARPTHIGGEAVIRCTIAYNGRITDCQVLSETPAGYGFGAAAVALATRMRINPITASGQSLAGRPIDLPVAMGPGAR